MARPRPSSGSGCVTPTTPRRWTITGRDVKNRSLGMSKLSTTAVSSLTGRAVSVASSVGGLAAGTVSALQTGGLMLEGDNPAAPANPYTAAPGSYLLQLVATSQGGTCGQTYKPSFGWNQGAAMGLELVGP